MKNKRPEIIAHRGASDEAPENSLAAFRRAVELGVDGVELDIQFTADRIPVVHHDATLKAAGSGAPGKPIHRLKLADARGLAPLATLDEVIAEIGSRTRLYVEIKDPRALEKVLRKLRSVPDSSAVHSFDHQAIAASARLAPAIRRGVLLVSRLVNTTSAMEAAGAQDLWQHVDKIDKALVAQVHAAGGRVIAWTVNDESRARELIRLGVDGICTDRPGHFMQLFGGALAQPEKAS